MENKNASENLILIPKCEKYIEYAINMILKLPKNMRLVICNKIDALIAIQRVLIRIMYKSKYIYEKKYMTSISLLNELGKLTGGYIKALGINYETDR